MTFWNWRRGPGLSATQGNVAMAASTEIAPIELYTADARIVGWIAPDGRRVTDLLTTQDELRLWRPSPGALDGQAIPPIDPASLPADGGEWESLATDRVILAMPPEWRASRQLRLHRRLRRAALHAGPFHVTGNVHLAPGVEVGLHLLRQQRFLPLTDAYILHEGEPPFEHVVSVAIVNAAHVSHIVPLMTLAQGLQRHRDRCEWQRAASSARRVPEREVWNWLADVGDAFRSWDRKLERLRTADPASSGCWAIRATRRNRQLVADQRTLFSARFPGSSAAWISALQTVDAPMPDAVALLWVSVRGDRLVAARR